MKQTQLISNLQPTTVGHQILFCCLVSVGLALVAAGCKPEAQVAAAAKAVAPTTAAADVNPVGTYNLLTVDGNKVPCTVEHDGHKMTITSGSFRINEDGTCSSQIVLAGHASPIEVKATYTRQGQKLTMQWQGAGMNVGQVEGDSFTMNNEGMVFAYRK